MVADALGFPDKEERELTANSRPDCRWPPGPSGLILALQQRSTSRITAHRCTTFQQVNGTRASGRGARRSLRIRRLGFESLRASLFWAYSWRQRRHRPADGRADSRPYSPRSAGVSIDQDDDGGHAHRAPTGGVNDPIVDHPGQPTDYIHPFPDGPIWLWYQGWRVVDGVRLRVYELVVSIALRRFHDGGFDDTVVKHPGKPADYTHTTASSGHGSNDGRWPTSSRTASAKMTKNGHSAASAVTVASTTS
jgi:hypothetical protein